MNLRWRSWSPWLGLATWAACLNPQPDTDPLATGPTAPAVVDVNPGEMAPTPPFLAEDPDEQNSTPPAQVPAGNAAPDAGVPAADAGPLGDPAVSPFATTDAGLIDPDAGVAPGSTGN